MFLFRRLSGRSADADKGEKSAFKALHKDYYKEEASSKDYCKEEASNKALVQASHDITQGKYERALWMLEKISQLYPGVKGVAELVAVAEVCYAAVVRPCACLSRQRRSPDWYAVLKVDEKSDSDTIKRRYRHLALLLHPDKNKHAKAEAAFKLVSEAYECLMDKKRRAAFNIERSLVLCQWCTQGGSPSRGSDRWSGRDILNAQKTTLRRPDSSPNLNQEDWMLDQEKLKIFRERARARVLGNLAKAWKDRLSRGFEEVDRRTFRSEIGRFERKTSSTNKEQKEPDRGRQQKGNAHKNNLHKVDDTKKSGLLSKAASELHHWKTLSCRPSAPYSDRQLLKPCKNLEVLIHDLRADLVSSIGRPASQGSCCWDKAVERFSETSTYGTKKNPSSNMRSRCTQENQTKGKLASGGGMECEMSASSIGSYSIEIPPKRERECAGDQACASSSLPKHLEPFELLVEHPFVLEGDAFSAKSPVWDLSDHLSSKQQSSPDKVRSAASISTSGKGGEMFTPDMVLNRPLSWWKEGLDIHVVPRSAEEALPEELLSHRRACRGDSLDMEEKILQTQKEKSDQLLKTLERLREEAKTVAATLDHIRYGFGPSPSVEKMLATPAYKKFSL